MTPKEKAFHLHWKFVREIMADKEKAKQCALIAVDEIIDATKGMVDEDNGYSTDSYWHEVKEEIEKL